MGAKRLGGERPGGKRLGGETTRGGNGLGAKGPGFWQSTVKLPAGSFSFRVLKNKKNYDK